jgi:hypothetical protein
MAQREHEMREYTERLESWLEQGVYSANRLAWLTNEMSDDDLLSMFAYSTNFELRQAVRDVLVKRGIDPEDAIGEPLMAFNW